MNLCLLVEGRRTEPRVYESWIGHTFPGLSRVRRLDDLTQDSYLILSGYGNPAYLVRIRALLREMLHEQGQIYSKVNPGVVLEVNYLDALRRRCASTSHLSSLQVLLSTWSSLV